VLISIDLSATYFDDSDDANDACFSHALPGQSQHQSIELGATQTQLCSSTIQGPDEFALVQSPGCQPDAQAVMHQHFEAIGTPVGKQVAVCGWAAPNTETIRAKAVSVPARMSMGVVASQMASMRIT